jgi:hypothetical protein
MKKKVIKRYRVVRKKQEHTTEQQTTLLEIKEETQKDLTEQMNTYTSYYDMFKSLSK